MVTIHDISLHINVYVLWSMTSYHNLHKETTKCYICIRWCIVISDCDLWYDIYIWSMYDIFACTHVTDMLITLPHQQINHLLLYIYLNIICLSFFFSNIVCRISKVRVSGRDTTDLTSLMEQHFYSNDPWIITLKDMIYCCVKSEKISDSRSLI